MHLKIQQKVNLAMFLLFLKSLILKIYTHVIYHSTRNFIFYNIKKSDWKNLYPNSRYGQKTIFRFLMTACCTKKGISPPIHVRFQNFFLNIISWKICYKTIPLLLWNHLFLMKKWGLNEKTFVPPILKIHGSQILTFF